MNPIIIARAPVRIDFAGGTLDLPPLHIFYHPVWTINAAISVYATVSVTRSKEYEVISRDQNASVRFAKYSEDLERSRPSLSLVLRSLKMLNTGPIRIECFSEAPAGAGLAGSSALLTALHKALFKYLNKKIETRGFIEYVKSVETSLLRVPTGYQDFWSAIYGGLNAYHTAFDGSLIRVNLGSDKFLRLLEESLVLVYVGKPRNSGINNWEMFKSEIDGGGKTRRFFASLRDSALSMLDSIKKESIESIGDSLSHDWRIRRKMIPSMSTPEIDLLEKRVIKAGAFGFRVCGAGGGGCALIVVKKEKQVGVRKVIEELGMTEIKMRLTNSGAKIIKYQS